MLRVTWGGVGVRPEDRERVEVEVVSRVMERLGRDPASIERALFDTLYEERRRLETDPAASPADAAFYDAIHAQAVRADPERQREILREVVWAFTREVSGRFDPTVYLLATKVVPPALDVLLNTMSPMRLLGSLPGGARLDDQVHILGEVERLKALARIGTIVMVPTHASNLDSVLMGYAIFRMGLPPFLYGAGLNLFSNKVIGFFLRHLGAYKVDRRRTAPVYQEVLKTYAGCTMEAGYHNLFFPGGSRSRSGAVESRLETGLLGMALNAYIHNLLARRPRPDVFVVPVTINYQLVLEAESLIEDHLKETGRSRYIIEDDEFSRPRRLLDFVNRLFALHSTVHIVVGTPLDVFGNEVDGHGHSLDPRGRPVDRTRYVLSGGQPGFDSQRDEEYTRELAAAVVESFHRNTVLKSVNLACDVVFRLLRERNPGMDLYRLLRTGGAQPSFPLTEVYARLEDTLARVRALEAKGCLRLDETLARGDSLAVLAEALAHLGAYHRRPAMVRRGDRLFHEDRNLLLYYGNRLARHAAIRGNRWQ